MEEIKKLHMEKIKDTEELAKNLNSSNIGTFLLKTHEEILNESNNLNIIINDMATQTIKRYLMLSGESEGIDLIQKMGGDQLYKDNEFKLFIVKINEYFDKIRSHVSYKTIDEYVQTEEVIYSKFKDIEKKLINE
jgi:hypothetical protein